MASVKATAMVALVAALATVGIAATVNQRAARQPVSPDASRPVSTAALAIPTSTSAAKDKSDKSDALQRLAARRLVMPVQGFDPRKLQDNFNDMRGGVRRHEALDIMAARGTPVIAADDGAIAKLFRSIAGGITVYQFDASQNFIYYYAHLDGY